LLVYYNKCKEFLKKPTKVAKWLTKLSSKTTYQNTKIDYQASHFWWFQRSNQFWLRRFIWLRKDLSKGYKIHLSNIKIGALFLKNLWIFEIFQHPTMRIIDKIVIIVYSYLRMVNMSKGVLFTKFLKETLRKVWEVCELEERE
jgi:hypothetical protein